MRLCTAVIASQPLRAWGWRRKAAFRIGGGSISPSSHRFSALLASLGGLRLRGPLADLPAHRVAQPIEPLPQLAVVLQSQGQLRRHYGRALLHVRLQPNPYLGANRCPGSRLHLFVDQQEVSPAARIREKRRAKRKSLNLARTRKPRRTGQALATSNGTRAIIQPSPVRSGSSTAVKDLAVEGLINLQVALVCNPV